MLTRLRALVSEIVIFVPQAVTVPKSFVLLPRAILPEATRLDVPVTLAAPVCVNVPVEFIVRLDVLTEGKARLAPVKLRPSSVVVDPIDPLKLMAPEPALIVR